jgi:hypothetical protein
MIIAGVRGEEKKVTIIEEFVIRDLARCSIKDANFVITNDLHPLKFQ